MGAKILYLLNTFPNWSETFIQQDLQQLVNDSALQLFPVALRATGKSSPVQVTYLQKSVSNHINNKKNPIIKQNLSPIFCRIISRFKQRKNIPKIIKFITENKITHIHAEFADLPALLAVDISQKLGITYSVGVHACDVYQCKYHLAYLLAKATFITVCNTAAQAQLVKQLPQLAERVKLIYHGIDLEKIQWNPIKKLAEPYKLLFVGRFVPKKGIMYLLQILQQIQNKLNFELIFVGTGELQQQMKNFCKKNLSNQYIQFKSVLSHKQVLQQMQKANFLLMPATTDNNGDRDGIPNVMLEAMAIGLPVVGRCVGSIGELLNEQTGWILPNQLEQANEYLLKVINTPKTVLQKKTEMARKILEEKFALNIHKQRRAELFHSIS